MDHKRTLGAFLIDGLISTPLQVVQAQFYIVFCSQSREPFPNNMHSILPALLTVLSFAGARAQPTESAVSLLPEIRAAGEFSLPCGCWNPCTIGDVAMGSFSNGTSHCDTTCGK